LNPVHDVVEREAVHPAVRRTLVCWNGLLYAYASGSVTLYVLQPPPVCPALYVFQAVGFQVSIMKPVDDA